MDPNNGIKSPSSSWILLRNDEDESVGLSMNKSR